MAVTVTPVDLHHRLDGPEEAPVLMLGTSLGTTLQMWDPQMPALSQHFRVLRFDHRGHGSSPVPAGPYALPDLAGDVVALLDRLQIDRASFCGLSLGGMVGMHVAAYAPEKIDRLVLCCTTARFATPGIWAERAHTVRARGMEAIVDAVVDRWFTPEFAARQAALVRRMRQMMVATPAEGYASCCDAIEQMDLEPSLAGIQAPTLVIAADRDLATPPDLATDIVSGLPDGRLVIVEDAAHLASVQQPAVIARHILDHLDDPGERP